MNSKCKNCGKEFELFNSEFCKIECLNEYYLKSHGFWKKEIRGYRKINGISLQTLQFYLGFIWGRYSKITSPWKDSSKEKMTLSANDLSNVVEKYQPITRYTIGENERHIMFHLERDKEISVLINQNDEDFEGLGQLRDKNERGVGKASSIIKGNSELDVIKKILDSLLGHNAKK